MMKQKMYFLLMAVCALWGIPMRAALDANPVDPALALKSRPAFSPQVVFANFTAEFLNQFIATGKIGGQILFQDDFSDVAKVRQIWSFARNVKLQSDGRGGNCIHLVPVQNGWSQAILFPQHYVPVDPTHQILVLWEARLPHGGKTPRIRLDFYDQSKKHIFVRQMHSNVDPTQPTLFTRNAFHVNQWMPKNAAFMRVEFHVRPAEFDKEAGDIANVTVVDLDQAIKGKIAQISTRKNFAKLLDANMKVKVSGEWEKYIKDNQRAIECVLAKKKLVQSIADGSMMKVSRMYDLMTATEKGVKLTKVLAYVANDLCSTFPLFATNYELPGLPGDVLSIRECPGEMTRGTVILWTPRNMKNVTVHFSSLRKNSIDKLPASVMSAKIVKAWYQGEGTPSSFVALGNRQLLMPELLLHDDSLVIPDHATKQNLIKYQKDGKSWYVNINQIYATKRGHMIPADLMPIKDASSLLPFNLHANENKQLAIRFDIPREASAGIYTGEITFKQGQEILVNVPVKLTVLPFELPRRPETIYSPEKEYTMGIYYWGIMASDGKQYISIQHKSREQFLNEIKMMLDNGITNPIMIWGNDIIFNESVFRQYLQLIKDAGMKENLYLGDSGNLGRPTELKALNALKKRLMRAMEIAKEYGFNQVYFYGIDEARGKMLISEIPAWKAAHEVGAKVIVSGYAEHLRLVGNYLDICVYAEEPWTTQPKQWHEKGVRLWKYNTPQAGCEDPNLYRRNYGLDLWGRGFDGASTYCFIGSSCCWNDIASFLQRPRAIHHYRSLSLVYPTVNGAIETLAITGLHDAIKDVRYMSLLRQKLRKKPNAQAEIWLQSLNFGKDDLNVIREQAIDWILKLN